MFVIEAQQTKYSSVNSALPGLDSLKRALTEVQTSTVVLPLRTVSQLELNSSGKTADGLSLSRHAMSGVTKLLANGLTRLVFDLAESESGDATVSRSGKGQIEVAADCSDAKAIALFNAMLKFRFSRLAGAKLLINTKTKCVDAVLGHKYQFYSNARFVELMLGELAKCDAAVKFHEAVLRGRNLVFRCQLPSKKMLVSLDSEVHRWVPGVYAVNSEVGDYSVGVLPMLISAADNGRFIQGEVSAKGRKFKHVFDVSLLEKMLSSTTAEAVSAIPEHHPTWQKMSKSRRQKLGLGGSISENSIAVERISGWLRKKKGVNASEADKVLEWIQTHGGGVRDTDVFTPGHMQRLASRSTYDLAVAVAQVGRRLTSLRATESMEKLAYSLMFGGTQKQGSEKGDTDGKVGKR